MCLGNIFDFIKNFFEMLFGNKKSEEKENGHIENKITTESEGIEFDNVIIDDDKITTNNKQNMEIRNNYHILIDNGHGKNTSGKRSPYSACGVLPKLDYYEYKWSREMAQMIVDELTRLGYDAKRIVTEETDVSLNERVKRVNSVCDKYGAGNVIMISIHSNAAGSGSQWTNARGWSAYTTRGNTKSDKLCECLYSEAEKNFKGMKIRKDTSDGDSDMEADFTVIKRTKCPAVLSENFFHDNVEDVEFLLSKEGKEKIMRTHVDGIIKYLESK